MIQDQDLVQMLNEQIINELESSQVYLQMAGWLDTTCYKGLVAKYRGSALEEHGHAMKFFDFLLDRDAPVSVGAVPQPPASYESVLDAAKAALAQERKVSGQIRRMYAHAEKVGDYETKEFLHWFLAEQVQEEQEAKDFMEYVAAAGDNAAALLMLDQKAAPAA